MDDIGTPFYIGTSGWTYDHWKGLFYPEKLPKKSWFDYYAARFRTVEVNATFYRAFKDQTYLNWYARAPQGFRYVLKVPRLITHRKYLQDADREINEFCRSACLLDEKLGALLLQLHPGIAYNPGLLQRALLAFGNPNRLAVEFRNKQWLTAEVHDLLTRLGTAFCSVDSPRDKPLDWVTSEIAYIRLHGRSHWYSHDYSSQELQEIAHLAIRMVEKGAKTVYIFFNNDFEGYAPKNALTLCEILNP